MDKLKKVALANKNLFILWSIYSIFFIFFSYFHYQRIAAFGCFDDCFNYVGGHFLLKGQAIYTDFFFNHSFLMPQISALIQNITSPQNIYSLVLMHKLFLFGFSFIFGLFLIFRFRFAAAFALVFYEGVKFYTFGDHFLGESFVVYPLIYLFGLVWEKINKRKIQRYDYVLASFFAWFIIFAREPYAPVTLILFLLIIVGKTDLKEKIYSILLLIILILTTFILFPINELFLNVFTYNKSIIGNELKRNSVYGMEIFNTLIYPLKIFLSGDFNIHRQVLIVFNAVFIAVGIFYTVKLKRIGFIVLILLLAVANIRPVNPGTIFYEAYHINVWVGLLFFSTFLVIFEILKDKKDKLKPYFLLPFIILGFFTIFSPTFFIYEKINPQEEFNTNYAQYFTYGEAVKNLSTAGQTLFLEERDDLIYWVANKNSSYKYQWYTAHMPLISKFKNEREQMFSKNPPDFYYDACLFLKRKQKEPVGYTRIKIYEKPSCLLIKNSILDKITDSKWESVKPLGFNKPQ